MVSLRGRAPLAPMQGAEGNAGVVHGVHRALRAQLIVADALRHSEDAPDGARRSNARATLESATRALRRVRAM